MAYQCTGGLWVRSTAVDYMGCECVSCVAYRARINCEGCIYYECLGCVRGGPSTIGCK